MNVRSYGSFSLNSTNATRELDPYKKINELFDNKVIKQGDKMWGKLENKENHKSRQFSKPTNCVRNYSDDIRNTSSGNLKHNRDQSVNYSLNISKNNVISSLGNTRIRKEIASFR